MKMNKKGFTLIEMLVVIAIIAVLVAIIIPTVSSATDKAGAAANAANLRAVYAELQTDKLAAVANSDGYVKVTVTAGSNGAADTITYELQDAPASVKTIGIAKGVPMVITGDVPTYGEGKTIEYFAGIAETGKAG